MRRAVLLLTLAGAMLVACAGVVLAQQTTLSPQPDSSEKISKKGEKIEGSYIVVLKEGADPDKKAKEKEQEVGLKVKDVYKHALKGFSANFSEKKVQKVLEDPAVAYVEQDQVVEADQTASAQQITGWDIQKIKADQSFAHSGNNTSEGSESVAGINAYVIDTGIASHPDLNVTEQVAYNATVNKDDCNGHGTHVAGSIGERDNNSYYVGVAPDIPLTGVKVLDCSGSGSNSGVIAGVDWVTKNATKPAIANMSLSGDESQALDDAVRNSAASGILYSVAAGNSGKNSCTVSPARAARTKNSDGTWNYNNGVIGVGATNSSNRDPSWSNYGKCTEVYAPGVNISSTWLNNGTNTISGTSMAAPHVGGVGALYLSKHYTSGLTMSAVERTLKNNADKKSTKNNGGTAIKLIDAAVTGDAGY